MFTDNIFQSVVGGVFQTINGIELFFNKKEPAVAVALVQGQVRDQAAMVHPGVMMTLTRRMRSSQTLALRL